MSNYVYVIDDIMAHAPNKFRQRFRNGFPATVRLQGGKSTTKLPPDWMYYAYAINAPWQNFQFASANKFKPFVGWHNKGDDNTVEQLTFAGNILRVTGAEGQRVYVDSYCVTDPPPVGGHDPALEQMFTVQYKKYLDLYCNGRNAKTLIVSNPGERLWIDVRNVIPYQPVDLLVTVLVPFAALRPAPSFAERQMGARILGSQVGIVGIVRIEQKGEIWGQLANGRWMTLRANGVWRTNWHG